MAINVLPSADSGKIVTVRASLDELIPRIFTDPRFVKTGRRRWALQFDQMWVGLVAAWRPGDYENHALNQEDIERLIEKWGDGSLDAGYVVLATIENSQPSYVGHLDAKQVYDSVKLIPPRNGQYGSFWLIREDFSLFDDLAEARKRF
jgi:hypothetical protein